MDFWLDVIKVIGSIIVSMAVCFAVYYIFFKPLLKKSKEEPDSVGDMIYSVKLHAQENHNAVIQTNIQTSHDVRESLSKEHLEIKQNLSATRDEIKNASSEIKSVSQEIDSLKLQIDFLISRDKEITNSIIGLVSSFEKVMKETNYTNENLSAEVKSLTAENQNLKAQINLLKHMHL